MSFASRLAIVVAVLAMPVGAAVASYALADRPRPAVPAEVRIGESAVDNQPSGTPHPGPAAPPELGPPPNTQPPELGDRQAPPGPRTNVVPPAPPLSDDDDDGNDDADDDGGGDDD